MFCPNCRAEYIQGITVCGECGIALVDELSSVTHPKFQDLVTVHQSYGPNSYPVAVSVLQAAEIPYYVQGENPGRILGTGGLMIVKVSIEYANDARALLVDVEQSKQIE